ncbi:hypothetical protein [Mycolicibacterium aubagnense]|uniref:Uncharacterized protein n=1 Tax=Mycolicibacterium aubagnense TaxID=319707 RepID=A0ABN5YQC1_9MYCO|nr:hypothetical protein [Mycolicibacterium aubagnense]TLH58488.1 hypothetical protein C1S80_19910 [Mycolicibacterium aubagnense]WGI34392.1 hypothetical protein QDT91_08645 [Mycolicibacterium aubagnense]BBX83756.1 hypothetical protein MAUB_16290 [Mycolicibacterium aubagnense]
MINFDASRGAVLAVAGSRAPLLAAAFEAVSRVGAGWHHNVDISAASAVPAAAVAAAMSAARLATSGHVADVPQHKRTAKTFAPVKRGTT